MSMSLSIDKQSANIFFNKVDKAFKDTSKLWKEIEKRLREEANKEFSDNANNWEPLTIETKIQKSRKGLSDLIGVGTGNLRKAATKEAIVKTDKDSITYSLNMGLDKGYFEFFNKKRPLFQHLNKVSSSILKKIGDEWANKQAREASR